MISDLTYGAALGVAFSLISVYKIISFYSKVRKYPPGPFALPFVGSIPFLQLNGQHLHDAMQKLSKVYGPVFTVWFGEKPHIFVYDTDACIETLKSKSFTGRPQFIVADHVNSRLDSVSISFDDTSKEWQVLRNISSVAGRRYAASYALSEHVIHVTDQVVDRLKKEKNSIDLDDKLNTLLVALLSTSAFGIKYDLEDKELKEIAHTVQSLAPDSKLQMLLLAPSLRFFLWSKWQGIIKACGFLRDLVGLRLKEHEETFEVEKNRDFTDSLLWAGLQAQEGEEGKKLFKCIDSWNIWNAVTDFFFAGSQTTRTSLAWWFLYSALDQDMQDKIREEINEILPGEDDVPLVEMKESCPHLMAFTSEVFRVRPVLPLGVPHKAVEDGVIAGHSIPAGATVLPSICHVMQDNRNWKDADKFDPYRFIDSETGKFIQRPNNYWLTFSTGKRNCIGEKLAMANMFLIIARFFQKTRGFRYEVTSNPKTQEERNQMLSVDGDKAFYEPVKYQLNLIPVTQESGNRCL